MPSRDPHQAAQLARVRSTIAPHVFAFCANAHREAATFTAADLFVHLVNAGVKCAPGSPDRVMRALAEQGAIEYQNVDRAGSEYVVTLVRSLDYQRPTAAEEAGQQEIF